MPDLVDRDRFERRVTRDVNRGFRELRAKVADTGRRPTESEIADQTEKWLIPALAAVFMAGAAAATFAIRSQIAKVARRTGRDAAAALDSWDELAGSINALSGGFDPTGTSDGLTKAALAWARRYAPRAAAGIARRTGKAFRAIGRAEDGLASGLLDFSHAEVIGITETTAANTAAEEYVIGRAARRGFKTRSIWVTEEDDKVCPICGRLHRKPERVWRRTAKKGPPAHVRCRCWLMILLMEIPNL